VPDDVAVKDKMLYASAKGTLKDKLGQSNFEQELHITAKDEFTWDRQQGGAATSADARSEFEVEKEKVVSDENESRVEYAEQITKKESEVKLGGGIGGYHSVNIPLSANAKSDLNRLKSGEINFLALAIDEAKTSINSAGGKRVDVSSVAAEIHTSEPRFYLYTQTGKPTVFIYSCPDKSPPKWRMVYSTSKPGVISQVTQSGINIASKKIEISTGAELKDELQDAQTAKPPTNAFKPGPAVTGRMFAPGAGNAPLQEFGGVVKARNIPTASAPHSIYSLMQNANMQTASTKKKIVIPPRAAWNG